MTKPISPGEIPEAQAAALPDFVIEAINKLLISGKRIITQSEATSAILASAPLSARTHKDVPLFPNDVAKNGWLNFESAYRRNGWKVVYDKPGYNESYEPHYLFSEL